MTSKTGSLVYLIAMTTACGNSMAPILRLIPVLKIVKSSEAQLQNNEPTLFAATGLKCEVKGRPKTSPVNKIHQNKIPMLEWPFHTTNSDIQPEPKQILVSGFQVPQPPSRMMTQP